MKFKVQWDEVCRAQVRAELRYILDPKEVHGEDPSTGSGRRFPGETFRVLKDKEIKQFGDASRRTRRLAQEAWDRLGKK